MLSSHIIPIVGIDRYQSEKMIPFYNYKPFSLQSKKSGTDAWLFGKMAFELWSTAFTTIVMRYGEFVFGWPAHSRRLNTEGKRMVNEKIHAGMEAYTACMYLALSPYFFAVNPWRAGRSFMAPFHRRARANARRLTHQKKY
jgi:hypothetical protein